MYLLFLENEQDESRQLLAVYDELSVADVDYKKLYDAGHTPRLVEVQVQDEECIDLDDVAPVDVWELK